MLAAAQYRPAPVADVECARDAAMRRQRDVDVRVSAQECDARVAKMRKSLRDARYSATQRYGGARDMLCAMLHYATRDVAYFSICYAAHLLFIDSRCRHNLRLCHGERYYYAVKDISSPPDAIC